MTRFLLPYGIWNTSDSYVLDSVGRPLWREDGSVFCMCRWPMPAQSFSGPSPLGLATVFHCLRSETSFSSPPTTRRVTVEVFDPASTRILSLTVKPLVLVMHLRHGRHRKHFFHYCVFYRCRGNVSTELFPSNGCCTVACLHNCYLAKGSHVAVYRNKCMKYLNVT
jgi:hypothetical protein